jgi:N-acetylneuraminate synthase
VPSCRKYGCKKQSRRLRRSLYIVQNVKGGDLVTHENVKALRPGGGCAPKLLNEMLGERFCSDFEIGTPMSPELIRTKE